MGDSAADYDAWYDTPRGRWIGETEFRLARRQLAPRAGETLLDVGCGTGWFTRRFAAEGMTATGLDPDREWLDYARRQNENIAWLEGDARCLPFPDASFDRVLSVAALCFIDEEKQALAEILRVTRKRFAVGWLNRDSLLYRQKAGHGAYTGARWRTASEVRALFDGLPVRDLALRSAVFLPGGNPPARALERLLPGSLPYGALLVAAGEPIHQGGDNTP